MHIMSEIGQYIKRVRRLLGITQAELAKKLGKKRDNIAKYETNKAIPPGNVLLEIQKMDPRRKIR